MKAKLTITQIITIEIDGKPVSVGDAMKKLESGMEHLKRVVKKTGVRDPRYCPYRRDRKLEP